MNALKAYFFRISSSVFPFFVVSSLSDAYVDLSFVYECMYPSCTVLQVFLLLLVARKLDKALERPLYGRCARAMDGGLLYFDINTVFQGRYKSF